MALKKLVEVMPKRKCGDRRVADHTAAILAAGFEPAGKRDTTSDGECGCDLCLGWRAALALQNDGSRCLGIASLDCDLEQVIAAWGKLPVVLRRAIMALIGPIVGQNLEQN